MTYIPPYVETAFPELKNLLDAGGATKITISRRTVRQLLDYYLQAVIFDEDWYLRTYPDVADRLRRGKLQSARQHYLEIGYLQSRLPSAPKVDEEWYMQMYPDVAQGIALGTLKSAMEHYLHFGYREGRHPAPPLAAPEVAADTAVYEGGGSQRPRHNGSEE